MANLGNASRVELVVVNPTGEPLLLEWTERAPVGLQWNYSESTRPANPDSDATRYVPARGWLLAIAVVNSTITAL